ncbi:MAG: hypothetical protein JO323_00400 [Acidobacteriia bacterium]|nr:hypothetical protein [Terriglobia bacterium]
MRKCTECREQLGGAPLILEQAGKQDRFCSLDCLLKFTVGRIQRRIARHSRRLAKMAVSQRRRHTASLHGRTGRNLQSAP